MKRRPARKKSLLTAAFYWCTFHELVSHHFPFVPQENKQDGRILRGSQRARRKRRGDSAVPKQGELMGDRASHLASGKSKVRGSHERVVVLAALPKVIVAGLRWGFLQLSFEALR